MTRVAQPDAREERAERYAELLDKIMWSVSEQEADGLAELEKIGQNHCRLDRIDL